MSVPYQPLDAQSIAEALGGHPCGQGYIAACPAHHDAEASLSITDGRDGSPKVYCHAGCEFRDISSALRALGLWPNSSPANHRAWEKESKRKNSEADLRRARIILALAQSDIDRDLWLSPDDRVIAAHARLVVEGAL